MNVPNPQGGSNFTPGVQGFRRVPLEDRFWAKVNKQDGDDACWLWTGALRGSPGKQKGYAEIFVDGRPRPASQVSWELEQGQPFPAGKMACHTCDEPHCVRPSHIFPGTHADNAQDAARKGRSSSMKLKPEQIVDLRSARARGETYVSIAHRLGVDRTTVSKAARRRTWTHV